MNIWQALVIGLLQGVTEILPISSTAHLVLAPHVLGIQEQPGIAFDVVMNFGSWVAIMIYFRDVWLDIVVGTLNFCKISVSNYLNHPGREALKQRTPLFHDMTVPYEKNEFYQESKRQAYLAFDLVVATVPALIAAFFFEDWIETYARQPQVIAGALIIGAVLLWLSDIIGKKHTEINHISFVQSILIGIGQMFALIPGFSRSGSTITAARFSGVARKDAATFAFLLGAPIILIATVVKLPEFFAVYQLSIPSIVAFVSAIIGTYITIHYFFQFIQKQSYLIFVIYRILLGLTIFWLIFEVSG